MNKLFKHINIEINTIQSQPYTDQPLKEIANTQVTQLFLDNSSPEKTQLEKPVQQFWGLFYYAVFLSTTRCQTSSPDRENNLAVIPLYLEANIRKVCPTKPSPTHFEAQRQPTWPQRQPGTPCVSPLRHYAASTALCVTPAWMTQALLAFAQSLLSLRGSLWPSICLSLLLRWSLGTISASLPRTHCPSLQLITDSISLSKPRSRKSND